MALQDIDVPVGCDELGRLVPVEEMTRTEMYDYLRSGLKD